MPANIKLIEARLDKAKAILNIYYKKEIQFITSSKKNWKFLLQSQVNFKYCYLLFELD